MIRVHFSNGGNLLIKANTAEFKRKTEYLPQMTGTELVLTGSSKDKYDTVAVFDKSEVIGFEVVAEDVTVTLENAGPTIPPENKNE